MLDAAWTAENASLFFTRPSVYNAGMNFTDDTPLARDAGGTIRVKGSRLILDLLVFRYQQGDTVEEIHECFPSASVEQIQKILSWYLANQSEVDEYIRKRDEEAEILRREIESQPAYRAFVEEFNRTQTHE